MEQLNDIIELRTRKKRLIILVRSNLPAAEGDDLVVLREVSDDSLFRVTGPRNICSALRQRVPH